MLLGLALTLFAAALPAQTLLKDFNPTPSTEPGSSYPNQLMPLPGGRLLLQMHTRATGLELWTTDGTPAGTAMVIDLVHGPAEASIQQLTELTPGTYLFTANVPGLGTELWRTDGTAAGTIMVADIAVGGAPSSPASITRIGGQVVFFADDGIHGIEPWRSDGTTAGTQMIQDVIPGPNGVGSYTTGLARLGLGQFVFGVLVGGQAEVWRSDTTAAGTNRILQLPGGSNIPPRHFESFGNRVLFEALTDTSQLRWVTDGTAAGTFSLGAQGDGAFQIAGNVAYFEGFDAATGTELWKTDGTVQGTTMVLEQMPGGGPGGSSRPWFVGEIQGDLLFFAKTPTGSFLFRSNGTAAGTTVVSNAACEGFFSGNNWGTAINNEIFFRSQVGPQPGLYRTDGSVAGTTLVTTVVANHLAAIGNQVLFAGYDGTLSGIELWQTNGTPAGTQLLLDLVPPPVSLSSSPEVLGNFRDRAIVYVNDQTHGRELWLSNGTPQGTQLLKDLEPGPASLGLLGVAANDNQMLIFANTSGNDQDPWFSDGTASGTQQLDIFPTGSGFSGRQPAAFGNGFVFVGNLPGQGHEPWFTDGTIAGTQLLSDLNPGSAGTIVDTWLALDGVMLFSAWTPATEYVLWRTDGTTAGTFMLATLADPLGDHSTFEAAQFQGFTYFTGRTASDEDALWRTDGTLSGTSMVPIITPNGASSIKWRYEALDQHLLVTAFRNGMRDLLAVDSTVSNVTILASSNVAFVGPYRINDSLAVFFPEEGAGNPTEMWVTDGTPVGTTLLRTILRVYEGLPPAKLGVDGLLLVMQDEFRGVDLWRTDGTAAGTQQILDLIPSGSQTRDIVRTGANIVFVADDGIHGMELFSVPFRDSEDWALEIYGSGCPGTSNLVPSIGSTGKARISSAQPFTLTMSQALPNTIGLLLWSTERGATEIPGCTIWLGGTVGIAVTTTDGAGQASLPIVAPPALIGFQLDAQFFAIDPAGAAFGIASATPAIEFIFGQ